MTELRPEQPDDAEAVLRVQSAAFQRDAEAELVSAVRAAGAAVLSLVATRGGVVVGHLLFSAVQLGDGGAVGLGPLAVQPELQGQGIGSALVREGLRRVAARGHGAVVVLGSPEYYGRFGFRPASSYGVRWEHPAPADAFQALELRAGGLRGGGVVRFHSAFGGG